MIPPSMGHCSGLFDIKITYGGPIFPKLARIFNWTGQKYFLRTNIELDRERLQAHLGQFLSLYSTLEGFFSQDPCGDPRGANMNISAKWAYFFFQLLFNHSPPPRDMDQAANNPWRNVQTPPFSPRLLVEVGGVEGGGMQVHLAHQNIPLNISQTLFSTVFLKYIS